MTKPPWPVTKNDAGRQQIEFTDTYDVDCKTMQGDNGGLWLGRSYSLVHLTPEDIRELVRHLETWLEKGEFE